MSPPITTAPKNAIGQVAGSFARPTKLFQTSRSSFTPLFSDTVEMTPKMKALTVRTPTTNWSPIDDGIPGDAPGTMSVESVAAMNVQLAAIQLGHLFTESVNIAPTKMIASIPFVIGNPTMGEARSVQSSKVA